MTPAIGLFIPCYVNNLFPNVGVASYQLLTRLGFSVDYPEEQTCCGQSLGNAGFQNKADRLAENLVRIFAPYDYVVAPSSSCVAFIHERYASIMPEKKDHSDRFISKVSDICTFLKTKTKLTQLNSSFPHKVSIHTSCHGIRSLHLRASSEENLPSFSILEELLTTGVKDIEIVTPERIDECCGFGGMFAIEEPEVSYSMGRDKLQQHIAAGARYITGDDSSCLMHLQGLIDRQKLPLRTLHITEILNPTPTSVL